MLVYIPTMVHNAGFNGADTPVYLTGTAHNARRYLPTKLISYHKSLSAELPRLSRRVAATTLHESSEARRPLSKGACRVVWERVLVAFGICRTKQAMKTRIRSACTSLAGAKGDGRCTQPVLRTFETERSTAIIVSKQFLDEPTDVRSVSPKPKTERRH